MLEILLLWGLTKNIGKLVEEKGRKSGWYKFMTVILWFGGEIIGAVVGALATSSEGSGQCLIYAFALVGAAIGAGTAYFIANSLSPLSPTSTLVTPDDLRINLPIAQKQVTMQTRDDFTPSSQSFLISDTGERFLMRDGLTIGQGKACDICVSESFVPRTYARIRFAQNAWFIQKEHDSEKDVYVNNKHITATRISFGDRISIENRAFTFEIL